MDLPVEAIGALSSAVKASFERTGVSYIDAEIAALPTRFGMPPIVGESEPESLEKAEFAFEFLGHFSPSSASRQTMKFRSIRIRALQTLPSIGPSRIGFTYRWKSQRNSWRDRLRQYLGIKPSRVTYVPIEVKAGREITISIPLSAPARDGEYTLEIMPTVGRKMFPERSIQIPMMITGAPDTAVEHRKMLGNYSLDHQDAIQMFRDFLKSRHQPPSLFLEVASGVNPHLLALTDDGHAVVASDICSNQMQLGSIFAEYKFPDKADRLMFASFDAFNPPFQARQFDGVCIFSALHHFPDPAAFLRRLSDLVKPGGLIGIFCEPCDLSAIGEGYIRDLLAGINEQIFAIDEYRHMFASVNMVEQSIRNDGGSLKAILLVT